MKDHIHQPTGLPERGEEGAATAEYATVTGAAAGLGVLLYKFLTSEWGHKFLEFIFSLIMDLIKF